MPEDSTTQAPLRIAFIADRFDPSKGGGEAYVADLARNLARRGHEIHVFAPEPADESPRVTVHSVSPGWPGKTLRMISFALRSARAAARGGFDIVHGTGKCLGASVFNPHGGVERAWLRQNYASCSGPLYRAWVRLRRTLSLRHYFVLWQQRRAFVRAERIIAISEMIRRDIIEHHDVHPDRIAVVYNGVDLGRFAPSNRKDHRAPLRESLGATEEELLLLTVGHNYRLKGLEPMVRALALLRSGSNRPLRLLVAGRGRPRRYRRLARRLGVEASLDFLGVRPDIEALYAAADIYVHPTFYDACSLALFEALASGLPVVTTRHNGAAWALGGEEGRVVEDPRDVESLAAAVESLFDEGAREAAGRAARRTAERFPLEENADAVVRVYRDLLAVRGSL
jgi:UDP-glucose:(heptosyl)LPS alpha-1,3-glucosyltransferase